MPTQEFHQTDEKLTTFLDVGMKFTLEKIWDVRNTVVVVLGITKYHIVSCNYFYVCVQKRSCEDTVRRQPPARQHAFIETEVTGTLGLNF